MPETLTPVEEFNAQLESALLAYTKDDEGTVSLGEVGFLGMVTQFLADPAGTAKMAGVRSLPFLKIANQGVESSIASGAARLSLRNITVSVDKLTLSANALELGLAQSKKKPHQIDLTKFAITPDIPISELGFPIPFPGKIGEAIFGAFREEYFMAAIYDMFAGLVVARTQGKEPKPERMEIDIPAGKNQIDIVLGKNGIFPNYPQSLQYKALKIWLASLAKKTS